MSSVLRDPVRPVASELLATLELESDKVHSLPGAIGRRPVELEADPRLSPVVMAGMRATEKVSFYDHIATVRDRVSQQFYVAFRETADTLFLRNSDPVKFPKWLMNTSEKHREASIFIQHVTHMPTHTTAFFTEWLEPIEDDALFDAIHLFLVNKGVLKVAA